MVQVENEYGSYEQEKCDFRYTEHLRDEFVRLLGNETLLFTTDGHFELFYKCGRIPGVYPTIDFGIMDSVDSLMKTFALYRKYQPNGPLVNSEYYSGWIDYWEQEHQMRSIVNFTETLDAMLSMNASVNM